MWFGVAPRMDADFFCLKDIGLSAQNLIIILSSIGIIMERADQSCLDYTLVRIGFFILLVELTFVMTTYIPLRIGS